MHLGEDDWRILGAEPTEKTQFGKSGKIRLYMVKNETTLVDPGEILYSLPTINSGIADVEVSDSLENIAVHAEDDWRQFEFVVESYESAIDEELGHIDHIYEHHKEGVGFRTLHLREKITAPLDGSSLTVGALFESFDIVKQYKGVAFNSAAALITGGFALQTSSGWLLWGQVNESGAVLVLNISQAEESGTTMSDSVDAFLERYGLYLIDWPRLFWCGSGKSNFAAYSAG